MPLPITATTAALLALILLALTYHVIFARAKLAVSIGTGGNADLHTRIRRHGNFTETVPLALIVLSLAELGGANTTALTVAAALLVVSRLIQPFGMHAQIANRPLRILGGIGTHAAILTCVVLIGLNQFT